MIIRQQHALGAGLFIAAAVLLVILRLHLPLLEPEEGRYAEIPREMLEARQILVPVLDHRAYLDKPPLMYWLNMASYRVVGANIFAARLIPCLVAWMIVVVVVWWGQALTDWRGGLASGAVLLTCPDFVYRAPMLTPNGLLALFVTCGWATGHVAILRGFNQWRWWLACGVFTSLGTLTKGPVAFVLVFGPLLVLLILQPAQVKSRWRGPLLAMGIASLVAAPWFILITCSHPEFVDYFLVKHHIQRAIQPFDHAEPSWFYLPQLLWGAGPWCVVAVVLLVRDPDRIRTASFPIVALAMTILFLSAVGSKRPIYLLPAYSPLAVSCGVLLVNPNATSITKGIVSRVIPVLLLGLTAGAILFLPAYDSYFSLDELLPVLRKHAKSDVPVVCYPHDWRSAQFDLNRSDMPTFVKGQEVELVRTLQNSPETICIAKPGRSARDLVSRLSTTYQCNVLAECHLAVVIRVRTKNVAVPAVP